MIVGSASLPAVKEAAEWLPRLRVFLLQGRFWNRFTRSKRNLHFQAIDGIPCDLNTSSVSACLVEERHELTLLNIEIQSKPLDFIELHKAENNSGALLPGREGTSSVNSDQPIASSSPAGAFRRLRER